MIMGCESTLVDLAIVNAKILTEQGIVEGGIAIDEGKIFSVKKEGRLPRASKTINANGKLVLPGFVDAHVHLRDLNLEYKEDFYSGTCAALAGGFTTVLDMPNTIPPTNSALGLREKMELAKGKSVANVGFFTCIPEKEEEFKRIKEAGAVGFKLYLHRPFQELDVDDDNSLLQALKAIKELDMVFSVHAEDRRLIEGLEERFKAEADSSPLTYPKTHPPIAEVKAVRRILSLTKGINPRLHFCHTSTGRAISLISKAKAEGLGVTCEVTPHHLLLSETLLNRLGGLAFVDPPLRGYRTRRVVWNALVNGRVDVVASDHAPHTLEEKMDKDIWKVPVGFPGLETTLPLILTMVKKGMLSLGQLVEVLARNPSRIFRLKGKGDIAEGFDADLTVVDVEREFVIDSSTFYSKAKYSPFDGEKVVGKPVQAFIGGQLVMDEGVILAKPGSGSILHPYA